MSGDYLSPSLPLVVEPLLVPDRLFHVPADLVALCGACVMTPHALAIGQDFVWFTFAGCIFALLFYDLVHILLDFSSDLFRVFYLWVRSKRGDRS